MARSDIQGSRELIRLLRRLSDKVAKKLLSAAVRKGATLIDRAASANLSSVMQSRKSTGKDIIVRTRRRKGNVRSEIGNPRSKPQLMWLEFGTTKQKPARPFLRPAFEANKLKALKAIREGLGKGIQREALKLRDGRTLKLLARTRGR